MTETKGNRSSRLINEQGDSSRLEIYRGNPILGPDGFQESPVSISLGNEADILALLRVMGFSEEAIRAFRSGEVIAGKMDQTPFGLTIRPESEIWLSKMKKEDRHDLRP